MAKATISELLTRKLNKFLTVEEYNDPVKAKRTIDAFWAGVRAMNKFRENQAKKSRADKRKSP